MVPRVPSWLKPKPRTAATGPPDAGCPLSGGMTDARTRVDAVAAAYIPSFWYAFLRCGTLKICVSPSNESTPAGPEEAGVRRGAGVAVAVEHVAAVAVVNRVARRLSAVGELG